MNPTRTQLLAVALTVLLVFPGVALGVVIGEPELTANIVGGPVTPGEETNLTVQVQNAGRVVEGSTTNPALNDRVTTARAVEVRLRNWDRAPITIDTGEVFLGSVPDGGLETADFGITVAEDAEPGTYTFKVEVEYDYTRYISEASGAQDPSSELKAYYVDVRIDDSARFEVVDTRSEVLVGDEGTVSVTMQNVGDQAASDASVSLTSPNGDVVLGGSNTASRYVGAWGPGENRTVTFDASVRERAGVQPYTLTALVNYEDEDGVPSQSKSLATRVLPGGEQTFSLTNADSTLQVGREGTLEGTVRNEGPNAARDAVVSVESAASGVDFEEREFALGTLEPGETVDFAFPVELSDSANAGERQFTYTVEYQNADGETKRSSPLNSRVSVDAKVPLFAVEATSATVEAGGSATVTLAVTNNGDETLRNVDAKAFVDDPLTLSNDEGFIPELAPGETKEFSVQVSSGGSALARTYALSIDFQYENADYETKLSDTYSVGVEVVQPSDDGGLPLAIVGGGLALVVLAGGVVWYRRR